MRLEEEADRRGVNVVWKPFLLGPIFGKQGWDTSPFNIYPAKGRYMWRDMQRRCDQLGLPLDPRFAAGEVVFPQHSVRAARTAIAALKQDWGTSFCRHLYSAQFGSGRDISDPEVIGDSVERAGGDADTMLSLSQLDANKQVLRANTQEAESLGLFGAPSFWVEGELFWGDDRLEEALDWALKT